MPTPELSSPLALHSARRGASWFTRALRGFLLAWLVCTSLTVLAAADAALPSVAAGIEASAWDDHKGWIIASLLVVLAQSLAIAGLGLHRRRTRKALAESEARLRAISERKQADLERELFQTFFNLSLEVMCIANADGYLKKVNPAFTAVLGYSAQELLSRPWLDFIIPEDRPAALDAVAQQLRRGKPLAVETRHRCQDGSIRILAWSAFADKTNRVIYATARDVTAQRASEEQLRKLWLAVEQTSHSIVITNLDASIEYVNQAFTDISGYAASEVLGQNPRLLQSGLTAKSVHQEMWSALQRGEIWQGEFRNKRKNGEIYTEAVRVSPVRQPDGRVSHYLAIKEDITQHKRAVDAIRESKLLLQRLIDSTPDWIHVTDMGQCFMLVNRSMAQALGQTPESMIGRREDEFLPPGATTLAPGDDAGGSGRSTHNPCEEMSFADGSTRVFDTFRGPLRDSAQSIYGNLCYRRDVTERFNTEQEQQLLEVKLRQAQKMELIGHLTGGIAHDFNNILASMFGYAELLQMSAAIEADPQLSLYLQEILQAGIRAKELVAQLLTFSHRRELASDPIMVAPIVEEVVKLLRSTLPTSISIKAAMAEILPQVLISPVQLHQILMNLGINARDAIAGIGSIEIKAEMRAVGAGKACDSCHLNFSGEHLLISVRDNGTGIAPACLPKIFDPFFTTKEVGRGSGLGLSVLHGIVHSANGHIEVSTALGEGTEFRIYLPPQSNDATHPPRERRQDCANIRASGRVMVVDDEDSIVGFITALLEHLGCTVIGLTSASEALRLFREDPQCIDMLITDQTMPDLSGAELARAMLARRPELPIVLSTGYSNAIDEDTARRIGIRRFLVKPVPAKILTDVVVECLAEAEARHRAQA